VKVFIQNEAGSFVKHFHNEKTLELKGAACVSRPYPFPYGFILNTTAEDGLNVDCFVRTREPLRTGQIIECDAIGLMEQREDGKQDHNVLAGIAGGSEKLDKESMKTLVDFVGHVFDHFPGKSIQVGEFCGADEALSYIARHYDPGTENIG